MFKKALGKLRKVASRGQTPEREAPKSPKSSQPRLLTAEGWKRLMMKKYRKSS